MQPNRYAIYTAPDDELPFLSVKISPRGVVEADECHCFDEAFHQIRSLRSRAEEIAERNAEAALIRADLVAHGMLNTPVS